MSCTNSRTLLPTHLTNHSGPQPRPATCNHHPRSTTAHKRNAITISLQTIERTHMLRIQDLLHEIYQSGFQPTITSDARGAVPGGLLILEVTKDRKNFTTLAIKSFH